MLRMVFWAYCVDPYHDNFNIGLRAGILSYCADPYHDEIISLWTGFLAYFADPYHDNYSIGLRAGVVAYCTDPYPDDFKDLDSPAAPSQQKCCCLRGLFCCSVASRQNVGGLLEQLSQWCSH